MRELEAQVLLMLTYVVDKLGQRDVSGIFARLRKEFLKYQAVSQLRKQNWHEVYIIHSINNSSWFSSMTTEIIPMLNWALRKYVAYNNISGR